MHTCTRASRRPAPRADNTLTFTTCAMLLTSERSNPAHQHASTRYGIVDESALHNFSELFSSLLLHVSACCASQSIIKFKV